MRKFRTDLALEAHEVRRGSPEKETTIRGVEAYTKSADGTKVTVVKILDEQGSKELCKPIGRYVTVEPEGFIRRSDAGFTSGAAALARELRELMGLRAADSVLVVGLGNDAVTPDALGPMVTDYIMVTRHLKEAMPEDFAPFRTVSAIRPGVLGTTGIESGAILSSVVRSVAPDCVVAVDALTARSTERLCRTVQLSDTGIEPGSGVGNGRGPLSRETLGVPVISVGVPTVADAVTLALDMAEMAGAEPGDGEALLQFWGKLLVTPKDIDAGVRDMARLVGYGINMALHAGISPEDIDMFVG